MKPTEFEAIMQRMDAMIQLLATLVAQCEADEDDEEVEEEKPDDFAVPEEVTP